LKRGGKSERKYKNNRQKKNEQRGQRILCVYAEIAVRLENQLILKRGTVGPLCVVSIGENENAKKKRKTISTGQSPLFPHLRISSCRKVTNLWFSLNRCFSTKSNHRFKNVISVQNLKTKLT